MLTRPKGGINMFWPFSKFKKLENESVLLNKEITDLKAKVEKLNKRLELKGWVSVDDYLPEDHAPVLIFNGKDFAHAERKNNKWFFMNIFQNVWIDRGLPTHWRPMPEKLILK